MTESVIDQYQATLKRGLVYVLEGVTYRFDEPRIVDTHTKEYMEEYAVDRLKYQAKDQEGSYVEVEERCKFVFEAIDNAEDLAEAKAAEKQRELDSRRNRNTRSPASSRKAATSKKAAPKTKTKKTEGDAPTSRTRNRAS